MPLVNRGAGFDKRVAIFECAGALVNVLAHFVNVLAHFLNVLPYSMNVSLHDECVIQMLDVSPIW
jgi:hypothetical protein